jgi:hypothetical protein
MAACKVCDWCGQPISSLCSGTGYEELDGTVIRQILGPNGEAQTHTYDACKNCMDMILAMRRHEK